MVQWSLSVAALLVAIVAFAKSRRLSKRLERMTESYWELRYEHGQLRARLNRLDPEQAAPPQDAAPQGAQIAFVPLASLKK